MALNGSENVQACDLRINSKPHVYSLKILCAQFDVIIKNWAAWIFFVKWLILFYFYTLQNCISFVKYQNESAAGIHVFPILNPPHSSLPMPFLWVVPVHKPQASFFALIVVEVTAML